MLDQLQDQTEGITTCENGNSTRVATLGFVDDALAVARSYDEAQRQADIMCRFARLVNGKMNASKTEIRHNRANVEPKRRCKTPAAGSAESGDGVKVNDSMRMTSAAAAPGQSPIEAWVKPLGPDVPFQRFGFHLTMNLDFTVTRAGSRQPQVTIR